MFDYILLGMVLASWAILGGYLAFTWRRRKQEHKAMMDGIQNDIKDESKLIQTFTQEFNALLAQGDRANLLRLWAENADLIAVMDDKKWIEISRLALFDLVLHGPHAAPKKSVH